MLAAIGDKGVNEGETLSFTATATDAPGQTLTFTLDAGAPVGASITPDGHFTWTPTEAQGPGSYAVTVRVTDNGSPNLSDEETITVTVNEVIDEPAAILDIDAAGVLRYTASPGIDNNLKMSLTNGYYTFHESGELIVITGAGSADWTGSGTNAATGPATSLAEFDPSGSIRIDVGDGNDRVHYHSSADSASVLIDGGPGGDTLVGPDSIWGSIWELRATAGMVRAQSGEIIGELEFPTTAFSAFENLTGGAATDYFSLVEATTMVVDGAAGSDVLDYRSPFGGLDFPAPVTVNLQNHTATGFGGFSNIEQAFSGGGHADLGYTLVGPEQANHWLILAGSQVFLNPGPQPAIDYEFYMAGFDNVTGGTADDRFEFTASNPGDPGSVLGIVDGGGGFDTLDYSAYPSTVTVNLQAHTATATGGVANIEELIGSSHTDTLIGPDFDTDWAIRADLAEVAPALGADAFPPAFFSDFENLIGGARYDTFIVGEATSITVNGMGGVNGLSYSGTIDHVLTVLPYPAPVTVNLQTRTATGIGGFANIEYALGSEHYNDTFIGTHRPNRWVIEVWGVVLNPVEGQPGMSDFVAAGFENLTGGDDTDRFEFSESAGSGLIDGGSGVDTLDYSAYAGSSGILNVNLQARTATNLGGFANIENLIGSVFDDKFLLGDGTTLAGNIDALGGSDWLDYSAATSGVVVNLSTGAATGIAGGILNFENVRGGAGNDLVFGNAAHNVLLGGAGVDLLFGLAGRDLLIGGLGSDVLYGGDDDDILIGGVTGWDQNDYALLAIMQEWTRANASYTDRVTHLRNGEGLSWALLNASTVLDDAGALDLLFGAAGQDWFWRRSLRDLVADRQFGELVN